MCGYFCIGFMDFMLKDKKNASLFSFNEHKKNDKIILKSFQQNLKKLKCIVMFATNTENLKKVEHHIFLKN